MNKILLVILFLLMIYIDKKRGIKLFISLFINFFVLVVLFYLIALGLNPIIVSLLGCLVVSIVILYFVNGKNIKTQTSLKSIIMVLLILLLGIVIMTKLTRIAGFGVECYEEINMFSYNVKIDYTNIAISLILISLIGATTDTSIAISSALYEIHENNKYLTRKELYKSGLNIGKDILCTTTNTLLFAFLGNFMTLVILFYMGNYSFLDVVNAKVFASEMIRILFSAMGCIIIIPITSYMMSKKVIK